MLRRYWTIARASFSAFMADNALSRGAAIAYYTIFSIAPVLLIIIAIAGLVFGKEAAQGEIVGELQGMMGEQAAGVVQTMLQSASHRGSGIIATLVGFGTLLLTASGVFGELQSSLNAIWKAEPKHSGVSALVRARLISLGLVMSLGFLLLVSLAVTTALKAAQSWLTSRFPGAEILFQALGFVGSFVLITVMFGVIYKVLPDKAIEWRDVRVGAIVTAFLFSLGKFGISLYIGSSTVASSYGAASALAVMLLWIYYSAQIFLLGAEFTKVYAEAHGSRAGELGSEGPFPLPPSDPHPPLADLKDKLASATRSVSVRN